MKILFYLLSCSTEAVHSEPWSPPRPNKKNEIISFRLVENDSDLVHGRVEVEDVLVRSSWTKKDCNRFDNDRMILFLRP
ncbi:hypothetical protein Pint_09212 [Pistacia integerrima]|uniref:Uncharacterized protein n=1 Tax=Pistacia integerrima TaxID=434235 RepID=A0ACC0XTU7_9ROSI|nr:hypothetical protein Pint_09212 [Pistacia integerrima]